jgi:hypothetical protein
MSTIDLLALFGAELPLVLASGCAIVVKPR